jgi:hypothetical protein
MACRRPLSPGLRFSCIEVAYKGIQLTTFSEMRVHRLVSLGQHMLATTTPPGSAALQQENPSGQQVSVP